MLLDKYYIIYNYILKDKASICNISIVLVFVKEHKY